MEKVVYEFVLKVYEPANMYEVPLAIPGKHIDEHGNLKLGYRVVRAEMTDDEFENFMEWARKNENILKVVGTQKF